MKIPGFQAVASIERWPGEVITKWKDTGLYAADDTVEQSLEKLGKEAESMYQDLIEDPKSLSPNMENVLKILKKARHEKSN